MHRRADEKLADSRATAPGGDPPSGSESGGPLPASSSPCGPQLDETQLRQILAALPDVITVIAEDGTIVEAFTAREELLSRRPGDLAGNRVADIVLGRWVEPFMARIQAALETDQPQQIKYSLPTGNPPQERWFIATVRRFDRGKGRCVLWAAREITEAVQARAALDANQKCYRILFEAAPCGLILEDARGRVVDANPAARRLLGVSDGDVSDALRKLDGRSESEILRDAQRVLAGETIQRELGRRLPDGQHHHLHLRETAMPLPDGEQGVLIICDDVTQSFRARQSQDRLEEQLRQAQRLEAMGLLAGGVAHDFRNQLTVVKGYCDLALREMRKNNRYYETMEEIRRAAERATEITEQLLAFGRQQVLHARVIDLNDVLAAMVNPLARAIGESVALEFDPAAKDPAVKVDRGQLEQAIVNLAINARDAMPEGGRATLSTTTVRGEQLPEEVRREIGSVPCVVVSLEDTGSGMDAETLDRIFEPFFSTKGPGRGTGLGLSMVYGFVQQSGGAVDVQSTPGEGSAFRIYLPRAHRPAQESDQPSRPERLHRGKEAILVVEDEAPVRHVLVRTLMRCGYRVIEAGDAEQAMSLATHGQTQFDAVITDVVMPGDSGVKLIGRLREAVGDLPCLFVTGYANDETGKIPVGPNNAMLTKPFSPQQLTEKLRALLETEA